VRPTSSFSRRKAALKATKNPGLWDQIRDVDSASSHQLRRIRSRFSSSSCLYRNPWRGLPFLSQSSRHPSISRPVCWTFRATWSLVQSDLTSSAVAFPRRSGVDYSTSTVYDISRRFVGLRHPFSPRSVLPRRINSRRWNPGAGSSNWPMARKPSYTGLDSMWRLKSALGEFATSLTILREYLNCPPVHRGSDRLLLKSSQSNRCITCHFKTRT
jgi:hypothetical protein